MPWRTVRIWLIAVACQAALNTGHMAAAQTADDLFDDRVVQEVRIAINERDLRELRTRFLENVYYPADFQWRDRRVRNVGVRSRGLSSRSATKLGLRIDFNRYVAGQTFLGLGSVILDNLVTDPALVRERVSMAFFERLGQPAPRESFARVYINDLYQGLYAIVEPVNEDFLARSLGSRSGYLFKRQFVRSFYGEELGNNPAAYRIVFEPETHELDADSILYSPIRDLFHEVNQPVDTVWRDHVGRLIDLAQFVTHVAIETFLSEEDGVLGFAGMANFYLYRGPESDRHRVIVWDKDQTFFAIDSPIFKRVDENILMTRALAFSDLRSLYLDVLERCARLADGWLDGEVTRLQTLIDAPAHEDTGKPYNNESYEADAAFLKRFARERPAFVLREVARGRAGL
jgi:spore coat protein CotH